MTLTTISPSTNKPILTREEVTEKEIQSLPKQAYDAFLKYRRTTLVERQNIIRKALGLLADQKDVLAEELTQQMGRPISYTAVEITTAIKRSEYLLKISEEALSDTDGEPEHGFKRYIKKVPVGPVLVLFAWNARVSIYQHNDND